MSGTSASLYPPITGIALIRLSGLLPLFFVIALPGIARRPAFQPPSTLQTEQNTVRLSADLVTLHATVQNSKGNLVSGLGKENFRVYEDGVIQQINSFAHEDIPVTVGLVIDNSGSMRPRRDDVIAAALAFSNAGNDKDQIFVVYFNEYVSFGLPANMPFTGKGAQLNAALSKFATEGKTALYDAVAAALDHLKKGDRDKKVLIVISDGADNASRHSLAQIMAEARQSEAIIYTIGLYDPDDPYRRPGSLKQMANATGGEVFFPESIKEAVPICEQIAHDVRNQYSISYIPTNTNYDGKYRVIHVKVEAPGRGRLIVRTRVGYDAPVRP